MYRRGLYQCQMANVQSVEDQSPKDLRPKQFVDWRDLPDEAVELEELRVSIMEALKSLPRIYREVFVLRDTEHMSIANTAEILKITISTTKVRSHRARLMMRERLMPLFGKPTASIWGRRKGVNPWGVARR